MLGKITVESEKALKSDDSCMQFLSVTPFVRQNKHPRTFLSLNIILLVVLAKIRGLESNKFTRNGYFWLFQWTF